MGDRLMARWSVETLGQTESGFPCHHWATVEADTFEQAIEVAQSRALKSRKPKIVKIDGGNAILIPN